MILPALHSAFEYVKFRPFYSPRLFLGYLPMQPIFKQGQFALTSSPIPTHGTPYIQMEPNDIDIVDNGALVKVFLLEAPFPWNAESLRNSAGNFWDSFGKSEISRDALRLLGVVCISTRLLHTSTEHRFVSKQTQIWWVHLLLIVMSSGASSSTIFEVGQDCAS